MTVRAGAQGGSAARGATHRGQYLVVFVVLAVLTVVELGVALSAGIPRPAVVVALVALALSKAALIALFYMHLRFETRILRLTVFGPLVAPAVYGIVLIAETAWRHS
ncbi:MAG TPA: cytochrome C oxidase subunit IV family protein, partial [Gemmatimonadales bacterium]|nr:cytochrome C oxidase subunit IV family protein [Gemmatimonadales bacterium]